MMSPDGRDSLSPSPKRERPSSVRRVPWWNEEQLADRRASGLSFP